MGGGDDPDVVGLEFGAEALCCELEESVASAEDVDELFRVVGSAHGPEAAADAAGHYDKMFVVHSCLDVVFYKVDEAGVEGVFGGLVGIVYLYFAENVFFVGDDGVC